MIYSRPNSSEIPPLIKAVSKDQSYNGDTNKARHYCPEIARLLAYNVYKRAEPRGLTHQDLCTQYYNSL